jgi:hypothetical protein
MRWTWNPAKRRWDGVDAQGRLVTVLIVPGQSDVADVPDGVPMTEATGPAAATFTRAAEGDPDAMAEANRIIGSANQFAQSAPRRSTTGTRAATPVPPYTSVDEVVALSRGPETVDAWNRLAKFASDLRLGRMRLDQQEQRLRDRAAALGIALPPLPWAGTGAGGGSPTSAGQPLPPAQGSGAQGEDEDEDGEALPDLQAFMNDPATVAARLATAQIAAGIRLQHRELQLADLERQLGLREQGAERLGQYRDVLRARADLEAEARAAAEAATLGEGTEQEAGRRLLLLGQQAGRERGRLDRAQTDMEWAWYPESAAWRRREQLRALAPTGPNDAVPEHVWRSWFPEEDEATRRARLVGQRAPALAAGGELPVGGRPGWPLPAAGPWTGGEPAAPGGTPGAPPWLEEQRAAQVAGFGSLRADEEAAATQQALAAVQQAQEQADQQYLAGIARLAQVERQIRFEDEQEREALRAQARELNLRLGAMLAENPAVSAFVPAGVRGA